MKGFKAGLAILGAALLSGCAGGLLTPSGALSVPKTAFAANQPFRDRRRLTATRPPHTRIAHRFVSSYALWRLLDVRFPASRLPISLSRLGRHAQCHQKPRHHVVGGNRAGEFHNLRGVEVLFDLREHVVGDFDVQHRQKAGRTRH